jgi:hypothetical protein
MLSMESLLLKGLENGFKHLTKQGAENKLYLPLKKMKIIFWKREGSNGSRLSTCVSHTRTCNCLDFVLQQVTSGP